MGILLSCSTPQGPLQAGQPGASASIMAQPVVKELTRQPLQGTEICFNAWDDNDNTLIDEGCGISQGTVQFMIAWPEPQVDFDLYVVDPGGGIAGFSGATEWGLTSSADCPGDGTACEGQNYENVYLEEMEIRAGKYQVRIVLETLPERVGSAQVALGVRLPGGSRAFEMKFFDQGQAQSFEFEVAARAEKE